MRRRRRSAIGVLLLLGILLWLLLRSCAPAPEATEGATPARGSWRPYFHLRDAAAVIEHCRTKIRPASYDGVLRGAHGALWASEGNAWDRTLLAAEALEGIGIEARIVPSNPVHLAYRDGGWRVLRLDETAAPVDRRRRARGREDAGRVRRGLDDRRPPPGPRVPGRAGPAGRGASRRRLRSASRSGCTSPSRSRWRPPPRGPATCCASAAARCSRRRASTGRRARSSSSSWRCGETSTTWRRELFSKENEAPGIPGHAAPRVGDRYAIVVSGGPLVPEVLETRVPPCSPMPPSRPLARRAARPTWCSSASATRSRRTRTRGSWPRRAACRSRSTSRGSRSSSSTPARTAPRPRRPRRDRKPIPALSLDALTERVEAEGPRARGFHTARGLANDEIETKVVADAGGSPVISASTILSRFRSQDPVVPARRLEVLAAEIDRLVTEEPVGTSLKITALAPDVAPARAVGGGARRFASSAPTRASSCTASNPVRATRPRARRTAGRGPRRAPRLGVEVGPAALLVDRLLVERAARADFRLEVVREPAWSMEPLPLTDGSVLRYRVDDGREERIDVSVLVSLADGVPGGVWFTQPDGSDVGRPLHAGRGPRRRDGPAVAGRRQLVGDRADPRVVRGAGPRTRPRERPSTSRCASARCRSA